jgi:hypothetical protein
LIPIASNYPKPQILNPRITTVHTKDQVAELLVSACTGLDTRLEMVQRDFAVVERTAADAALALEVFAESAKPKVRDALTKQQRASVVTWNETVQKTAKAHFGVKMEGIIESSMSSAGASKKQKTPEQEKAELEKEVTSLRKQIADAQAAAEAVSPEVEQLELQIEAMRASVQKAKEDAQKATSSADDGLSRGDKAISGVLAVWLASRVGGATVQEITDYVRALKADVTEELVMKILRASPPLFRSLGNAGKLWAFKAYDSL